MGEKEKIRYSGGRSQLEFRPVTDLERRILQASLERVRRVMMDIEPKRLAPFVAPGVLRYFIKRVTNTRVVLALQ